MRVRSVAVAVAVLLSGCTFPRDAPKASLAITDYMLAPASEGGFPTNGIFLKLQVSVDGPVVIALHDANGASIADTRTISPADSNLSIAINVLNILREDGTSLTLYALITPASGGDTTTIPLLFTAANLSAEGRPAFAMENFSLTEFRLNLTNSGGLPTHVVNVSLKGFSAFESPQQYWVWPREHRAFGLHHLSLPFLNDTVEVIDAWTANTSRVRAAREFDFPGPHLTAQSQSFKFENGTLVGAAVDIANTGGFPAVVVSARIDGGRDSAGFDPPVHRIMPGTNATFSGEVPPIELPTGASRTRMTIGFANSAPISVSETHSHSLVNATISPQFDSSGISGATIEGQLIGDLPIRISTINVTFGDSPNYREGDWVVAPGSSSWIADFHRAPIQVPPNVTKLNLQVRARDGSLLADTTNSFTAAKARITSAGVNDAHGPLQAAWLNVNNEGGFPIIVRDARLTFGIESHVLDGPATISPGESANYSFVWPSRSIPPAGVVPVVLTINTSNAGILSQQFAIRRSMGLSAGSPMLDGNALVVSLNADVDTPVNLSLTETTSSPVSRQANKGFSTTSIAGEFTATTTAKFPQYFPTFLDDEATIQASYGGVEYASTVLHLPRPQLSIITHPNWNCNAGSCTGQELFSLKCRNIGVAYSGGAYIRLRVDSLGPGYSYLSIEYPADCSHSYDPDPAVQPYRDAVFARQFVAGRHILTVDVLEQEGMGADNPKAAGTVFEEDLPSDGSMTTSREIALDPCPAGTIC